MDNIEAKSKRISEYLGLSSKDIVNRGDELLGTLGLGSLELSRIRGLIKPKPTYQTLIGLTINQILDMIDIYKEEKNSKTRSICNFEYPLTPMQESYLTGAIQGKPCQIYTEIDIRNIDIATLKGSIYKVAKKHPMLNAKIVDSGRQVINEDISLDIPIKHYEDFTLSVREDFIDEFRSNPDSYWDVGLSKIDTFTRVHVIIDMIFIDATSAIQICKEIANEYNNTLLGKNNYSYNTPKLDFLDYCEKLSEKKTSVETLSFWETQLEKLPNYPKLPSLSENQSNESFFEREYFTLKTEFWDILKKKAIEEEITPNSLVIAIFSEILKIYSENQDFTLAITKSNRPVSSEQNYMGVVGNFTDVTLCPIIDRDSQNVILKAKEINDFLRKSMDYEDISGIEVIKMIKDYNKDTYISFPIVFTSFLSIFDSNIELNGESFKINYQRTQTPQISLDCQIYENDKGLVVNWDYDDKIYRTDLIRNMIDEMENLMIKLAFNHSSKAGAPKKFLDLINEVNDTTYDFKISKFNLLHDLILNNENKYYSKIALIDQEFTLSYGEMIRLSRLLAGKLQQKGIEKGTHVPIILKKGWEQVVSALAVLMAGGTFVPLNHRDPEERLSQTVQSLNNRLVISNNASVGRSSTLRNNGEIDFFDITFEKINRFDDTNYYPVRVEDNQLAYIIFTSGSTGKPKGVEISHNSALNTCLDINEKFSVNDKSIAFGISAFNFDLSIWDIFGVLSAGGTLVICADDKVKDPNYWWSQIQKNKITIWNTVPTTFEMLIEAYCEDKTNYLELALLSGDAIRFSLLEKAQNIFPKLEIIALGGATEASIWSNYHICSSNSIKLGSKLLPYGKPLSN